MHFGGKYTFKLDRCYPLCEKMNFLLLVPSKTKYIGRRVPTDKMKRVFLSLGGTLSISQPQATSLQIWLIWLRAPPGAGLTAENPKQKLRSLLKFCQTPILKNINLICSLPLHIGPHQNLTAVCWIPQLLGCTSITAFTLHKDRSNHLNEWLIQRFVQQARLFSTDWMPSMKLPGASICKVQNLEVFQKGIRLLLCSTGKIQSSLLSFKIQMGWRRGWWNTSYEKLSWSSMGRTESTTGINCCNFRSCHDFSQS